MKKKNQKDISFPRFSYFYITSKFFWGDNETWGGADCGRMWGKRTRDCRDHPIALSKGVSYHLRFLTWEFQVSTGEMGR